MDCFLGCFGFKDYIRRRSNLFSRSFSWNKKKLVVPRNHYASLGPYKEKDSSSEKADREIIQERFDLNDRIHQELRPEAKFRKTHCAILDNHFEIRKASDYHHLASDDYDKRINWGQQLAKSSHHPTNIAETSTLTEEKSKSCQFEKLEELDSATSDVSPQTENQIQEYSCESPYPTPLNLVPGMLTPATVYPCKPQNFTIGTIQSQFLHAIPYHSQNIFELKAENLHKLPHSSQNDASRLLKPQISRDEGGLSHSYYSPDLDKPIAGEVAGHCEQDEHSRISPTQWDGNGIPNSTTKYKEDQKVNWHATPFEVRLEKVLSDEKVYPHRNLVDGKIE